MGNTKESNAKRRVQLAADHQSGKLSANDYAKAIADIDETEKAYGINEPGVRKTKLKGKRLHVRADLAHGGSLHVSHHMSDRDIQLDGVDVSMADAGDAKPIWIQLAKPGTFKGHPAGPFTLDSSTFSDIVRNFKATSNQRIPIDFEHASEADPTQGNIPVDGAPAQGWITDVKVDNGNLWGLVEWGTKAREYIKSGQYRFFSPAIRFGARDRVTGDRIGARMTSGALTNNPFLDGLKPLAAKDAKPGTVTIPVQVQLTLTTSQDADEPEDDPVSEAAVEDNEDDVGDPDSNGDNAEETTMKDIAEATAKIVETQAEVSKLTLTLKDRDSKIGDLEGEVKKLRDEKAKRDEKDLGDEVELAFATYKDVKKLSDTDKGHMLAVLKAAPESFRAMYPKVAPQQRHLQRDLTDKRELTAPGTSDDAGVIQNESFLQTTKRLMKDEKMSYQGASNLAFKLRNGG